MLDVIAVLEGYTEEDKALEAGMFKGSNAVTRTLNKLIAFVQKLWKKFLGFLAKIKDKVFATVDDKVAAMQFSNMVRLFVATISACRPMEACLKQALMGNDVSEKMKSLKNKFMGAYSKFSDAAIKTGASMFSKMTKATQKKAASTVEKAKVAILQMLNHTNQMSDRLVAAVGENKKGTGDKKWTSASAVFGDYVNCQSKLTSGLNILLKKCGMTTVTAEDERYADSF